MSHSHPSRVSQTIAADVSQRQSAAVNTPSTAAQSNSAQSTAVPSTAVPSTAMPVEAPARPFDALMLAIRADAARDAAAYLRSTAVPFGGE
jgi:hypothetical protein